MRFFIILLLAYSISCQNQVSCIGYRQPFCPYEQAPVCGISRQSKKTFNSKCLACADPQVLSFIPGGPCKQGILTPKPPNLIDLNYTYCQNSQYWVCSKGSRPVCGINSIGEVKTFSNECEACENHLMQAYLPGNCKSLIKICTDKNRIDCSMFGLESTPSCHFYKNKTFQPKMISVCCKNDTDTQIIMGNCPLFPPNLGFQTNSNNTTGPILGDTLLVMCNSSKCSSENRPVCARRFDGLLYNYSTGCQACNDSNITSYFFGVCPSGNSSEPYIYCPLGNRQIKCSKPISQVCAIQEKGLPFDNQLGSCFVCSLPRVTAYLNGSCQNTIKTCPKQRLDCTRIKAPWIQSCAFWKNKIRKNVPNNLCCIGTTYVQVMRGRCPVLPP